MKSPASSIVVIIGAVLLVQGLAAFGQDKEEKMPPLTLAHALKLGPEGITKFTNESEAGQDEAARLYAAARRIETEHALAQRDLPLVLQLAEWRETLADCRGGPYALAYIVNGGGTMYTHGSARDCAEVEEFLGDFAKRLPLGSGKGDAKAAKEIDNAIAYLKTLKAFDDGDAASFKETKARLAAEVKQTTERWESLKQQIKELPAAEARKVASFAVGSLSWLKEDTK